MKRLFFTALALSSLTAQAYGPDFGPSYGPIRCVPRCEARFYDGQCARPAPDFCGPGAKCVPRCFERFSSGGCARWGEDYCALENWGYPVPAATR